MSRKRKAKNDSEEEEDELADNSSVSSTSNNRKLKKRKEISLEKFQRKRLKGDYSLAELHLCADQNLNKQIVKAITFLQDKPNYPGVESLPIPQSVHLHRRCIEFAELKKETEKGLESSLKEKQSLVSFQKEQLNSSNFPFREAFSFNPNSHCNFQSNVCASGLDHCLQQKKQRWRNEKEKSTLESNSKETNNSIEDNEDERISRLCPLCRIPPLIFIFSSAEEFIQAHTSRQLRQFLDNYQKTQKNHQSFQYPFNYMKTTYSSSYASSLSSPSSADAEYLNLLVLYSPTSPPLTISLDGFYQNITEQIQVYKNSKRKRSTGKEFDTDSDIDDDIENSDRKNNNPQNSHSNGRIISSSPPSSCIFRSLTAASRFLLSIWFESKNTIRVIDIDRRLSNLSDSSHPSATSIVSGEGVDGSVLEEFFRSARLFAFTPYKAKQESMDFSFGVFKQKILTPSMRGEIYHEPKQNILLNEDPSSNNQKNEKKDKLTVFQRKDSRGLTSLSSSTSSLSSLTASYRLALACLPSCSETKATVISQRFPTFSSLYYACKENQQLTTQIIANLTISNDGRGNEQKQEREEIMKDFNENNDLKKIKKRFDERRKEGERRIGVITAQRILQPFFADPTVAVMKTSPN